MSRLLNKIAEQSECMFDALGTFEQDLAELKAIVDEDLKVKSDVTREDVIEYFEKIGVDISHIKCDVDPKPEAMVIDYLIYYGIERCFFLG